MFYWTKYVKKSVSIIGANNIVNNWAEGADGKVELKETLLNPFVNVSHPRFINGGACGKFMCDFIHFSGKGKPWLTAPHHDMTQLNLKDPSSMWYNELFELNKELNMGLNFSDWKLTGIRPALGLFATFKSMDARVAKVATEGG